MKRPPSEQSIYAVIAEALRAGALQPGSKLGEQKLADVFGVTRERVRKVLHRLGHERLIDVIPNRGAFVVDPSLEDAREIYDARRIVEGGIAWRLATRLTSGELDTLRAHFAGEQRAHARGRRFEMIQLSGAFHILLAELTHNPLIVRQMQELVSRTSMLVALFEEDSAPDCGIDEHRSILRALEARDAADATSAMLHHLSSIETRLHPRTGLRDGRDIEAALRAALRRNRERHVAARSVCAAKRAAPARSARRTRTAHD
jgi:DNA-binding GntR family transcriptional regulator